ncbi:MAG: integrase core domain-containing protein [Bacteroidales bacterium]|jgi:transposase InsO family protein|nr:integrase core domain-containing protein [Bacteroidales bacterium]
MEERKEIVCKMVSLGMRTVKALRIAKIPRSSYYYRPTGIRKGKEPSTYTLKNGLPVSNEQLVSEMNVILGVDFIDYGYTRTTKALVEKGYLVNKKKIYRLMKINHLLLKRKEAVIRKNYVDDFIPLCTAPFQVMEIDIKYVFIHGLRKNAYLITIFDVFSRAALAWSLDLDMKASRAVLLVNQLLKDWLIPWNIDPKHTKVSIRTDNGSQFIATLFRNHLQQANIPNEYIKPATPEQNGHIESFHATLTKLVCNKYYFENLDQARDVFVKFFYTYNRIRIMKAINYKTPFQFLKLWKEGRIDAVIENKKVKYFFREETTSHNQVVSSSEYLSGNDKIIPLNDHFEIIV